MRTHRSEIWRFVSSLVILAGPLAVAADLGFRSAEGGEFRFDTGVLRGTLRAGGKSMGLTSVVHVPSGRTVSGRYGLFGHYRQFSANRRHGDAAWYDPSDARLNADGSVEAHWPATDIRPFELWAIYKWSGPATFDVETRVRPRGDLSGFESFLASYFTEEFNLSMLYVKDKGFAPAEEANGRWQMSPRDEAAVKVISDGRWRYPPSPVDWAILPALIHPLGVRRAPASGIAAAIMAPAGDCFAVSTPSHADKGHNSLYLSLFGRDIKAGETASAHARLVIGAPLKDKEVLRAYRQYVKSRRRSK